MNNRKIQHAKKSLWLLPAALLAMAAMAALATTARAQSLDYVVARDTPDWFKSSFLDFNDDVDEAAEEGKRVMIYFGQDGCPYCKKLHDLNYRQADIVGKMRANLDSIVINIFGDADTVWTDGAEVTEKELAKKLNIQFTPTLLFLDEDGNEILRLAGYQPPKKFTAALSYVIDRREQTPFADYLREAPARSSDDTAAAAQSEHSDTAAFAKPPYSLAAGDEPTVVFVTHSDCEACDEWRAFLTSDEAAKWRERRRMIEVNLYGKDATFASDSGNVSEAQWTADQKVAFVPALIFIDGAGEEQFRVDGYLRAFHLDSVFDYVVSDAYRSEPEFQRFLQARADHLREQGEEVSIW